MGSFFTLTVQVSLDNAPAVGERFTVSPTALPNGTYVAPQVAYTDTGGACSFGLSSLIDFWTVTCPNRRILKSAITFQSPTSGTTVALADIIAQGEVSDYRPVYSGPTFLVASNNLADVDDPAEARESLGLDTLAAAVPGSMILCPWSAGASAWTYGGTPLSSRPSSRTDIFFLLAGAAAVGSGGPADPAWMVSGDARLDV